MQRTPQVSHDHDTPEIDALLSDAAAGIECNDTARAKGALHRILEIDPRHAEAQYQLARIHQWAGQFDQAIKWIEKAKAAEPGNAIFCNTLGNLQYARGALDDAWESYSRAASLKENFAEAYVNLAMILCRRGQIAEGIQLLKQAITVDPRQYEAHHNLGNALQERGDPEAAAASYRTALEIKPDAPETYYLLGTSLQDLRRFDEAEHAYRQAIQLNPDHSEAYYRLGRVMFETDRLKDASIFLSHATRLRSDFSEAYIGLGVVALAQQELDDAVSSFDRAIVLDPSSADAHNNLGQCFRRLGQIDKAVASCRRALDLKPDWWIVHSNLVFLLNYSADWTPEEIFCEHLGWARCHAVSLKPAVNSHRNVREPDRTLRIGYVSADFRHHAVSYFFELTLKHHDRDRFELFCYSNVRKPDAYTDRMRGYRCIWRDIVGQSDEEAARLITNDQIDILVDLGGHTAENRLLVFARKPAPIQITWNGYPNTTGMEVMDYRITDTYADPPGMTEHLYTERLIRLPEIYMAYRPSDKSPPVGPPPSVANGYVTFGSFNTLGKVGPQVIAVWARILKALPDARLMVLAVPEGQARARLTQAFTVHGIEAERLEFVARLSSEEFLEAHQRADIALDPFPFNGAMTTCQTLWMGVPLVTLAGKNHVSRVGVSMLSNLGLERLIARDVREYVSIAVALAQDRRELAELRAGLRERMITSPNTNGARLTRFLEVEYEKIWKEYCLRTDV